jgi:hypothetical protein
MGLLCVWPLVVYVGNKSMRVVIMSLYVTMIDSKFRRKRTLPAISMTCSWCISVVLMTIAGTWSVDNEYWPRANTEGFDHIWTFGSSYWQAVSGPASLPPAVAASWRLLAPHLHVCLCLRLRNCWRRSSPCTCASLLFLLASNRCVV